MEKKDIENVYPNKTSIKRILINTAKRLKNQHPESSKEKETTYVSMDNDIDTSDDDDCHIRGNNRNIISLELNPDPIYDSVFPTYENKTPTQDEIMDHNIQHFISCDQQHNFSSFKQPEYTIELIRCEAFEFHPSAEGSTLTIKNDKYKNPNSYDVFLENFKFNEENIKFYYIQLSKKDANGHKTNYYPPESTNLILSKTEDFKVNIFEHFYLDMEPTVSKLPREISYILDNLGKRTFIFPTWLFAMQNFNPLITDYLFHHVEVILLDSSPSTIKNIQNLIATNLTITSKRTDILRRKIELPPMTLQTQHLELNRCCFPFIIHQFASHITISSKTTSKTFEWLGSISNKTDQHLHFDLQETQIINFEQFMIISQFESFTSKNNIHLKIHNSEINICKFIENVNGFNYFFILKQGKYYINPSIVAQPIGGICYDIDEHLTCNITREAITFWKEYNPKFLSNNIKNEFFQFIQKSKNKLAAQNIKLTISEAVNKLMKIY
jgi:hypothetical protein